MSAHPFEPRVARLEGAYEQVNERLAGFDRHQSSTDAKIDAVRDGLSDKIDHLRDSLTTKMDAQFRWVIGLIIVSILVPLVARFTH